ncbi:ThuA domain-containing protein [Cohnella yongneupensis]|uniref:ThuA domain-containing protein n=1 Tax=Cohnella yongneupensis TaxID=425006 RepID=A0ABW0QY44_9BACL
MLRRLRNNKRTLIFILIVCILAASALVWQQQQSKSTAADAPSHLIYKVLVFSKTAGFRHDSIPAGIEAIKKMSDANHFTVDATEDASVFTEANLAQYAAVIFLSTTGDVLDAAQQAAFEKYIESGKGYVGIHSASDTEYSWPWYGDLIGTYFKDHPEPQSANVIMNDLVHPSTSMLPPVWTRTDEWYNFKEDPRGKVHVLATLDEKSYKGGTMGFDHPTAWCQAYDGGRAWYTGGGHTIESFADPIFMQHVLGGIQWAAGQAEGDCTATDYDGSFEKVTLQTGLAQPLTLKVAQDGKVYFIERSGNVKVYDPATAATTLVGKVPVYFEHEDGLLGLELDPNFAKNSNIYLYYSPQGSKAVNRLSRFTLKDGKIAFDTEKIVLETPIDRTECCHSAGDLEFDSAGNLFLSLGDNTDPFESDGFGPMDERKDRAKWDAQRTAGNTQDLRGKILRIKPKDDGTYEIPEGNLFPADGSQGRPEIFVMGDRNPYRITTDPYTNWLYWGEVGPDAGQDRITRGPKGYDEVNQAKVAGNYGWPYCIADNKSYNDYDFLTTAFNKKNNCAAIINNSPNNTGISNLPPAQPALIYYPYGKSAEFPELEEGPGGRTAVVGSMYKYDPELKAQNKFPQYFDRTLFFMDWSRNWIKEVRLDKDGNLLKINPFMPGTTFKRPVDIDFGPDGTMYMLEYGTGWGDNNDAILVQIKYTGGVNKAPVIAMAEDKTDGMGPLAVKFSTEGTADPEGNAFTFKWDFESDGTIDSTEPSPAHTYDKNGQYVAKLTVEDDQGGVSNANVTIVVGNNSPKVTIDTPYNGGFFAWGDTIPYTITATDTEDSSINCDNVGLLPSLGHDQHAHADTNHTGCSGTFTTVKSDTNIENTFYILEATYTDNGANGVPALTGKATAKLFSEDRQAEHADELHGVEEEDTSDTGTGKSVAFIENGDWIMWKGMNLHGIDSLKYRVSSAGAGGTIEMHADKVDGPLLASVQVKSTGDWQKWETLESPLQTKPSDGQHDIYFVFKGGDGFLFNVNWLEFVGPGITGK